MKRLGVAAALLVLASTARAQDAQCTAAAAPTRDACQKAVDIFKYLAPQLGATIAGGNTIMGSGGVLGGLPHWTVGIRATAISGSLPQFTATNAPSVTALSPVASAYTTKITPIAFPAVDGAIGIFGGIPLGLTKIGGVDLLVNGAYVPTLNKTNVSIVPTTNLKFGGGLRVGLLQESLLVPGISVSVIQRGLPKTTITTTSTASASAGTIDTLQIKDLDLTTTSFRLTISKSLILFGVAAGVGMDKYKESTGIYTSLHRTVAPLPPATVTGTFTAASNMTQTNAFVDAYLNILLLKIVGEVGMVTGGTMTTFNTFDKLPTAARPYGAIGLRVGF
jgi:hypothetical protein